MVIMTCHKIVHEWLPDGTKLRGRSRKKEFYAEVVSSKTKTGKARLFNNKMCESMSGAARAATGYSVDGWIFWKTRSK